MGRNGWVRILLAFTVKFQDVRCYETSYDVLEQPLQQRITELRMTVLLMLRNPGLEDKHLVGIKRNFLLIFHNLPPAPFSLLFLPPWRRERLPTPALWPGEFHGCKELDTTEQLSYSLTIPLWNIFKINMTSLTVVQLYFNLMKTNGRIHILCKELTGCNDFHCS